MRISKYTSVPSKDIDNEHNESALSEPGETSEPLWVQGTDSPPEPEDDSYETMEGEEREIMLSKEKGEDDTIVDLGENWEAYYRSTSTVSTTNDSLNRIQFDDVYNGSFYPQWTGLSWSSAGDDGVFIYRDDVDNIILEQISDRSKKTLVKGTDIIDGWRHSYSANYYIFNISSKTTFPLTKEINSTHQARISYVTWSPVGHNIAFVKDNDVYVSLGLTEERRITYDGSDVVFNGVPDWIYEEEVLAAKYALWWSPDGKRVAYLRLNESEVPEYRFPLYVDGMHVEPYVKYPKPGYPNPIATFYIYDTSTSLISQSGAIAFINDFPADDKIITEVCWVGNDYVLVRVMNRVQDIARVVLVDAVARDGTTVREENADKMDGGWFEITRSWVFLQKGGSISQDSYIDVVVNDGYNHLAIFSPINSSSPRYLTSGNWEVVDGVKAVDRKRELITEKSSIERHLYSVSFDGKTRTALTPTDETGYYAVDFSTGAEYYNLKYEGPDVPWQKVLKVDNSSFEIILHENNGLKELLKTFDLPTIRRFTVESDGNELNVLEIRPPGMDETGREKHPVLFQVYEGPTSQYVNTKFSIDWHSFLASSPRLKYVVVFVDSRGTGFKGRAFRCSVRKHLGEYESTDVINTAKYWASLPYVDSGKMAVWGWSFGGFVTSKIIEMDSGVFQVGMAVAPVTDWRFYDSIYTERYMKTPELNPSGYENSAITNMSGFDHAKFLVVHGTGDGKCFHLFYN
ncbi:35369_t:CDS:10 [Gigaspora margarita]|uniref:35369_t:CDS:1 n=1 Tax=Gigaspora margarita TaxID=4874 RepID=A0ABN7V201_GIGMA|nr:35369_t:CDS:10 [Gigaspora margarita]